MKNQTFGIEIEMNHITRQRAAQVVAETLGEGATFRHTGGAYDAWEVTAPDGRRWKLVSDASIAGPRDQGTEFVSPISAGKTSKRCRPASGPSGRLGHTPTPPAASTYTSALGSTPPTPCGTWSTWSTPRKTS